MPKVKARKKRIARTPGTLAPLSVTEDKQGTVQRGPAARSKTLKRSPAAGQSMQNLLMTALVALGCWGLAFTFMVFSNDANRYIFGGMAIVMALMWSVSFSLRFQKFRAAKQG